MPELDPVPGPVADGGPDREKATDNGSGTAPDHAADLALLIEAARAAGQVSGGFWRRDPEVWSKGDDSPVSEADLAVNDMLGEVLRAARPDYGWLSEETPDDPGRLDHDRVFIVDPIDGTRAFVEGQKTWAHALAVAEAGRVIAGVVFLPLREELYAARLGGGASLNDTPLAVSPRGDLEGAGVLANRHALDARHWPGGAPRVDRHVRPALAHRLALVSEGRFDASLSFGKVWEWDSAAGSLLVSEAGGAVTDRSGGVLRFNQPDPRSSGVLAASPALHAEMVDRSA
ncbi:MAG: 3'(2'),5'-bisphosphate nucleotidase CysQ [Pseudomonadota bacterium]